MNQETPNPTAMRWSAAWDNEPLDGPLPEVTQASLQRWHAYAQIGQAMRRHHALAPAALPRPRHAANAPRWWMAAMGSAAALVWGVWLMLGPPPSGTVIVAQQATPSVAPATTVAENSPLAGVLAEHRAVSPSALRVPVGFVRNVAWSGQ